VGVRHVWHRRLHEEWANERLYFWRLAFYPTYVDHRVREGILQAFDDHSVRSYAMYELFGLYDVILRAWLPTRVTQTIFQETLERRLAAQHIQACDMFSVGDILRHWPWTQPGSKSPDSPFVVQVKSDEWIEIGNRLAEGEDGLDSTEYKNTGALAECRHLSGIKFVVVVTSSSQLLTVDARGFLRSQLEEISDRAAVTDGLDEISLYEGAGFCQFLLLGKVSTESFFLLRTKIIDEINNVGAGQWFGARTYTYVSAVETLPLFQEQILTATSAGAVSGKSIETYLEKEESQELEVKASAFVDINQWVYTGKCAASESITNEGILRAIVGMLNASGGTIIVGALERKRFPDWQQNDRLQALPCVGDYLCCGIEVDLQGRDWDSYARKIQQIINQRIQPPPTGLVTVVRAHEDTEALGNMQFCVISVQETDREWFYMQVIPDGPDRYLVRFGNETQELSGPVADGYKRSRPRG